MIFTRSDFVNVTVPVLKLDLAWDPLRADPRIQALLDKYAAISETDFKFRMKRVMASAYPRP